MTPDILRVPLEELLPSAYMKSPELGARRPRPERTFYRGRTQTMSEIAWQQDGIDSGWYIANGIGSVRSAGSYGRPGGWWFLPGWLPDTEESDIG
ncbi:protein of unknown function [Bradyrhizobium vignae]|uniref:Uncharacterized protein n=1 Tax=Bradyrhizobium vignae TaxID=1549949 RepID=A0A2U3Q9B8_9BRAD|nr:protein of unknown function [Bradyrhizobium vignae]